MAGSRPVPAPKAETFKPLARGRRLEQVGSLSNPGSSAWEDVLDDLHPYQQLPHNGGVINTLRTIGSGRPVFHSEGGVGSAIDLVRLARHFEQLGRPPCEDATVCRGFLDQFMADWQRWKLDEAFANPETTSGSAWHGWPVCASWRRTHSGPIRI